MASFNCFATHYRRLHHDAPKLRGKTMMWIKRRIRCYTLNIVIRRLVQSKEHEKSV